MIEKIANQAANSQYFKELFNKLEYLNFYSFIHSTKEEQYNLTKKELNDILRFADIFASSNNAEYRNYANRIVSNLYSKYFENPVYLSYASTVFTKMGLFPSIEILSKSKQEIELTTDVYLTGNYKKKLQFDKDLGVIYTDKQFEVVQDLKKKNNFSLSAPTSFGKTMIITNFINGIIQKGLNCNICILVPTNALLKEVALEMQNKYEKNSLEQKRKVITYPEIKNTNLHNQYTNLIFVFTPERLIEYFSNNMQDIEYLFIDEAQKILKPNDDRTPIFYGAVSYAAYRGTNLFFLSPNIENPEIFLTLADRDVSNIKNVKDKLVIQNRYLLNYRNKTIQYLMYNNSIIEDELLSNTDKIDTISKAVKDIYYHYLQETSTIVYFASKQKMIDELLSYIKDEPENKTEELEEFIKFIQATIHEQYFLVDALKKGIAFHYGSMPKIIREKIEDLFRKKIIKVLFTTSTLLEGVNLQAKNIILTSDSNGKSKLSEEDFLNLIGRAGRFKSELFGNIICIQGNFEHTKTVKYGHFASQNICSLKSEILNTNKNCNFFKDIKQIVQSKLPISKELKEKSKKILQQYANIAILHNSLGYNSKLKSNLIEVTSDFELFKSIEKKTNSVHKLDNFRQYLSIPFEFQQAVYEKIDKEIEEKFKNKNLIDIIDEDIKLLTTKIMKTYHFYNRDLVEYENSDIYIRSLLIQWIKGRSLNVLIKQIIRKIEQGKIKFLLDVEFINNKTKYNRYLGTPYQINLIINDIFDKIEKDIKHVLKLYFSNYIYLNIQNSSMHASMIKLVDYIEFGTMNSKLIELQKYGFSRELAYYILERHLKCISFSNDELENIDFDNLFQNFDKTSILYDELKEYKYLLQKNDNIEDI